MEVRCSNMTIKFKYLKVHLQFANAKANFISLVFFTAQCEHKIGFSVNLFEEMSLSLSLLRQYKQH